MGDNLIEWPKEFAGFQRIDWSGNYPDYAMRLRDIATVCRYMFTVLETVETGE